MYAAAQAPPAGQQLPNGVALRIRRPQSGRLNTPHANGDTGRL
jgi:hypothetical protein